MKILFISMEYPPETGGGGIGSYVAVIAPALADRGHEVHVLSCVRGQNRRDYRDGEVWIHRRDQLHIRGLWRLVGSHEGADRIWTALSCSLEMRRLGLRFDVIEFPDWMGEGLFVGRRSSRRLVAQLHTPLIVIDAHDQQQRRRWDVRVANMLERTAVRRANLVISPSALLVHHLESAWGLDPKRIRIARLPIDDDRWSGAAPIEGTRPVVLAVGRIEHNKGADVLVEAAAKLKGEVPEVEVVLVGRSNGKRDGKPYADWLRDRARELGAPCRFISEVPRSELLSRYGEARVVALASRFDNFPVVGLEAMAAGRPVVCTTMTGTAEIVANTGAGDVVPVGDSDALALALHPYLDDVRVAADAGRIARSIVREGCSVGVVAAAREALFQAALDEKRPKVVSA